MFTKILQLLSLACKHRKLSRPIAAAPQSAREHRDASWDQVSDQPGHYVVCLDCGKKFVYDWTHMRVIY
jgi:hypothetical protein